MVKVMKDTKEGKGARSSKNVIISLAIALMFVVSVPLIFISDDDNDFDNDVTRLGADETVDITGKTTWESIASDIHTKFTSGADTVTVTGELILTEDEGAGTPLHIPHDKAVTWDAEYTNPNVGISIYSIDGDGAVFTSTDSSSLVLPWLGVNYGVTATINDYIELYYPEGNSGAYGGSLIINGDLKISSGPFFFDAESGGTVYVGGSVTFTESGARITVDDGSEMEITGDVYAEENSGDWHLIKICDSKLTVGGDVITGGAGILFIEGGGEVWIDGTLTADATKYVGYSYYDEDEEEVIYLWLPEDGYDRVEDGYYVYDLSKNEDIAAACPGIEAFVYVSGAPSDPSINVTSTGLTGLKVGVPVTGSIIYELSDGTYGTIIAANFAPSGLPAGLTVTGTVKTNDTTVTVSIAGTPTTYSATGISITLPTSIPKNNVTGAATDIVPTGTVTTSAIAKGDGATVSGKPTVNSITYNSITVNAVTNTTVNGQTVQYAINETSGTTPADGWQDSTIFSGLEPGTEYFVHARTAATDNYNAGAAQFSAGITTAELVEIAAASVTVTLPAGGANPVFTATSGDVNKYTTVVEMWWDDTEECSMDVEDEFVAGQEYSVIVKFTAKPGYLFADTDTLEVTFNEEYTGEYDDLDGDGTYYYWVTFTATGTDAGDDGGISIVIIAVIVVAVIAVVGFVAWWFFLRK